MTKLATVKQCLHIIHRHPALAEWFFRNRARNFTLSRDRRNPDGISRFPRGVTFKPTLACNLRCKMCVFASTGDVDTNPKDCLPLESWTTVVDDIAAFRPYISLTGGEPLLYPQITDLIRYIKDRGLVCTLTTNGVLLSRNAPALMENPPNALIVSLDGPAEIHDELRGRPGTFEKAVDGIKTVQRLKQESGRHSPLLVINSAITSFNYKQAADVVDIAHDLGVNALNYQHQWWFTDKMVKAHNRLYGEVHPVSVDQVGEVDLPAVDAGDVAQVVRDIHHRSHIRNGGFHIGFHPNLSDSEVQRWYTDPHNWVQRQTPACAWMNTDILPSGDVEPCPGMVCGNITEAKFTDIWNNDAFREHRQRLSKAGDFPICVRCCAYFRRD